MENHFSFDGPKEVIVQWGKEQILTDKYFSYVERRCEKYFSYIERLCEKYFSFNKQEIISKTVTALRMLDRILDN